MSDLDPTIWASILRLVHTTPDTPLPLPPTPTIIEPGRDRVDLLAARVSDGCAPFHPADADGLPDHVGKRIHRGNQGQITDDGLTDTEVEMVAEDEMRRHVPPWRSTFLERWGIRLGNPKVRACDHCGWQHERDGCCSWCGMPKHRREGGDE